MNEEKLNEALWSLYSMETGFRMNGNPVQADQLRDIRIKIKESMRSRPRKRTVKDLFLFLWRIR